MAAIVRPIQPSLELKSGKVREVLFNLMRKMGMFALVDVKSFSKDGKPLPVEPEERRPNPALPATRTV